MKPHFYRYAQLLMSLCLALLTIPSRQPQWNFVDPIWLFDPFKAIEPAVPGGRAARGEFARSRGIKLHGCLVGVQSATPGRKRRSNDWLDQPQLIL
jgi:hypothetical protein